MRLRSEQVYLAGANNAINFQGGVEVGTGGAMAGREAMVLFKPRFWMGWTCPHSLQLVVELDGGLHGVFAEFVDGQFVGYAVFGFDFDVDVRVDDAETLLDRSGSWFLERLGPNVGGHGNLCQQSRVACDQSQQTIHGHALDDRAALVFGKRIGAAAENGRGFVLGQAQRCADAANLLCQQQPVGPSLCFGDGAIVGPNLFRPEDFRAALVADQAEQAFDTQGAIAILDLVAIALLVQMAGFAIRTDFRSLVHGHLNHGRSTAR